MKRMLVSFGVAAMSALSLPLAISAQQAAEPVAPATVLSEAAENALADVYVIVLEDGQGGMGSLSNDAGDMAILVFLEPASAEDARQSPSLSDMDVAAVPLNSLLAFWEGPIVFRGGDTAQAAENAPGDQDYAAPAFLVLTDGQETQIDMGEGPITPVMLHYDDASQMADQISAQGIEAETVEIVPIEFGAIVGELQAMSSDEGYRVFTHPGTVDLIRSIENQQGPETE